MCYVTFERPCIIFLFSGIMFTYIRKCQANYFLPREVICVLLRFNRLNFESA